MFTYFEQDSKKNKVEEVYIHFSQGYLRSKGAQRLQPKQTKKYRYSA